MSTRRSADRDRARACARACIFSPSQARSAKRRCPMCRRSRNWAFASRPSIRSGTPCHRIAMLSGAFAKAFEDQMLWEQMQKAGEYLKLLTRAQVEEMVGKQTDVIEKYKELLG